MKALTLLALTVTLLLSAGCSGALPLDNGTDVRIPIPAGTDDPPIQKRVHGCSGSGISLAPAGEAPENQSAPDEIRPERECKGAVPITQ
jgi:hypothetical protein